MYVVGNSGQVAVSAPLKRAQIVIAPEGGQFCLLQMFR